MRNKFFLVSQVFFPDEVSTANLFTNLCAVIAEDDFEVEVWCAQPSYSNHSRQPYYLEYKKIKIHYLPSTNFSKDKIAGRFINIITFSISVFLKLLFSAGKETVFTHTTPPTLNMIIAFVCGIKQRKLVTILLDIFPEGLIRLGKVSGRNIAIRLWHSLFIYSLKKSCKIIVLGRDMQSWLKSVCPEVSSRIIYLPLWQDENLICPVNYAGNSFVINNKLDKKFVVQYSGNMGLWNDMKTLGEAVNEQLEGVIFLFIGGGVRKKELIETINPGNENKVLFLPFQPSEKFGMMVTACHVAIVSMSSGLEGMAVPSKIYGILASGVPVIAVVPKDSEISLIVKEENCGLVTEPGDAKELVKAIKFLKLNENIRLEMGKKGRRAFEQKYTTTNIAERYKTLISSLSDKSL